MTTSPLKVLVVENDASVALAIAAALRRRGHRVSAVDSARDALACGDVDVLVAALALNDRSGADLRRELVARGSRASVIFLADAPTLEDCREALRLGARDLLAKPFGVEDLVAAVERVEPAPALPIRDSIDRCSISANTDADGVDRGMRELLAFLVRGGFGPSTRARVASAVHELVANVANHAHGERISTYEIQAAMEERELVVAVVDHGAGFDSIRAALAASDIAAGGLARAAALAEDLKIESKLGRGTRVTLRFASQRVDFEGETSIDLSELDYLTPETTARVLASLRNGADEPLYDLSPALAVSVGRLLAGSSNEKSLRVALWS